MTFTLVALEHDEDFIQFIDPELVTIKETIDKGGLRTLHVEYVFQDFNEDREMFKIGNKLWLANDDNISNCLYVINTVVKEDVYKENTFTFDAEEVLVELNYAPLFSQTELTKANFKITSTNGKQEITVNWNALNYWFGDYFNIGVVQDCIQDYSQKIAISGTMTRMSLLRYIEQETGNVFVTRYEKDLVNNTIHRFLDFLNPINNQKNWVMNIEYDFVDDTTETIIYDENDDPIATGESTVDNFDEDDITIFDTKTKETNIDKENLIFRITDGREIIYSGDTPLEWEDIDLGDNNHICITLEKLKNDIGIAINNRSFAILGEDVYGATNKGYIDVDNLAELETINNSILPDDCYLEIFDSAHERVLYQTQINHSIGTVHTDILDFGYNIENVTYEIDETETFTAISPILSLNADSSGVNSLSRSDLSKIITDWKNLEVSKGATVPMIVQKITQEGETLLAAKQALGNYDSSTPDHSTNTTTNWWSRPVKPNDQAGQTYEFWKGTAYWKAPFTKHKGDLHVSTDASNNIQYNQVMTRPDSRDDRGVIFSEKMGTVETSDEDMYAIFNDVCMKLKEKQNPGVTISVDVANLRNGKYNQYNLHDKVYVKLPDTQEIVACRVTGTVKEPHDIAKNSITLSNYSIKNSKVVQDEVYIQASNTSFVYPNSKTIECRLINVDYDPENPEDVEKKVQYPANKLISFMVYKSENGSLTPTKKVYTKRTNAYGYASISFKDDPGKYEIEINYSGDEEFTETTTSIQVVISGAKTVKRKTTEKKVAKKNNQTVKKTTTVKKTNTTTKSKPVKKTATKAKPVVKKEKNYLILKYGANSKNNKNYNQYGRSPDNSSILAIGRKTNVDPNVKNNDFYESEFFNKCPVCGKPTLIWSYNWANDERKTWGQFPLININKNQNQNGLIVCSNCHYSWSVFGHQISGHKDLTKTKYSTIRSDKSQAYLLKQGKIRFGYDSRVQRYKRFKERPRIVIGSPSQFIRQKALAIVGDSIGMAAAQKIAAYMGENIRYVGYSDFHKSPDTVIRQGGGNCCDQTRCMLNLMDAAGCSEYFWMKYVYVCCSGGGVGHVFARLVNKSNIYGNSNWRYVDPCKANPWGNYVRGWGSPPGSQYNYPNRPF